ncbi:MAG: hypothetical protein N4A41_10255 [Crocinitomicaceae bacterium]|jgi:hypothetical protein|nr:hypothetical protein [Crocinitomicaceae bacterium]
MLKISLLPVFVFSVITVFGQSHRDLTPGKKRQAFGKRDFQNFRNYGIQLSFGATYTYAKKVTAFTENSPESTTRYEYRYSPEGGLGGFLELGMAHFPEKGFLQLGKRKVRIISYWDWGLGVKALTGQENFDINYFDAAGNQTSSASATASFRHVLPYARISAHHNFYFKNGNFIDLGAGFNFDYRVIGDSYNYDTTYRIDPQVYSKAFFAQMHAGLGYGFKVRRGFYIIPSFQMPILGFYEWNKGNPNLLWFSSTYRPLEFRMKFIWLFKQKSNGCNTGTEEDQKRNKEYLQNR